MLLDHEDGFFRCAAAPTAGFRALRKVTPLAVSLQSVAVVLVFHHILLPSASKGQCRFGGMDNATRQSGWGRGTVTVRGRIPLRRSRRDGARLRPYRAFLGLHDQFDRVTLCQVGEVAIHDTIF
ncbi:MAG: hypothetical protein U5K36_04845, partial [Roseovarius sp.]|nr:hypothetical protein [Roseovarius sp.]